MTDQKTWVRDHLALLDQTEQRLNEAIERLGSQALTSRLGGGWTVKEMLAHLAFWEETCLPVVECMFRGKPEIAVEDWHGGDDLGLAPGVPWPDADTHNRREAKWALAHTDTEVLQRLSDATQMLRNLIRSLSDDEVNGDIGNHLSQNCHHTAEHIAQLEALYASD